MKIMAGRDEIAMIELDIGPGFEGPSAHTHNDHVDAFYVLEGDAQFQQGSPGAPSYVLVNETSFEVFRGIWLKVSPQLRTPRPLPRRRPPRPRRSNTRSR